MSSSPETLVRSSTGFLRFDPEPVILAHEGAPLPPADDGAPLSSGYPEMLLEQVPEPLRARDRGCADVSAHVEPGQTVLDLGCGAGPGTCVLAQRVGARGHVIGVDLDARLIELVRGHAADIGQTLGYRNLQFHRARVQDLALDLEALDAWLAADPIDTVNALVRLDSECDRLRLEEPLLAAEQVDVAVANLTLSQVRLEDRGVLFHEIARVIVPGGTLVVADLFASAPLPDSLRDDSARWVEGVGGAFVEDELRALLAAAGFERVTVAARADQAYRRLHGLELRAATLVATRAAQLPVAARGTLSRGWRGRLERRVPTSALSDDPKRGDRR